LDGGSALSQGRYLHRTTQTKNKRRQTNMPRGGFKPMFPVFERAKMVHALDRVATMIGNVTTYRSDISMKTRQNFILVDHGLIVFQSSLTVTNDVKQKRLATCVHSTNKTNLKSLLNIEVKWLLSPASNPEGLEFKSGCEDRLH
jgi:hypothetical protein